jgi:cyclophilin family peptidyl-prolyl cis-trans isomerase
MLDRALVLAILLAALGCDGSRVAEHDAATNDEDSGASEIPEGWSATPFLASTPTRAFSTVGDGTDDGVDYGAVLETDAGAMVIDLAEAEAPITVGSFVWLARHRFFEGIAFHRVIAGFMAQSGDPNTVSGPTSTWGTGGPGYQFGLEIDPSLSFDGAGVVGMANAGPETNGSQFFITFAAAAHLDGGYTIFGRVIDGLDTLSTIAIGEPPPTPTRILAVTIIER